MIKEYVNKLIENLPPKNSNSDNNRIKVKADRLDVVLDGGMFNGSYLAGALYFLKEMERRRYVKVERVSGCSIGAIAAFMYFINSLDLMQELYSLVNEEFKTKHTLHTLKQLKILLQHKIPDNVCDIVNGRLYICYNDVVRSKKVIKSRYKNVDDIIDTLIKSCYVPMLIDGNMVYKGAYMDGINAYIFKPVHNKRILHMELFSYDKCIYALNVKNEKTNFHRILTGLLDIHSFYIKQSNTSMCSYVHKWTFINQCNYNGKWLIEKLSLYIIRILLYLQMYLPPNIKHSIVAKISSRIVYDIFSVLLEAYCV